MNESEKLDKIIEHLCETKKRIIHWDLSKILKIQVTEKEARYLFNKLLADQVVRKINTGSTDEVISIDYSHQTQKFRDSGGYQQLLEEAEINHQEKSRIENIKNKKLSSETKLISWQVKTFWWIFIIGFIGGLCGIVSLIIQFLD